MASNDLYMMLQAVSGVIQAVVVLLGIPLAIFQLHRYRQELEMQTDYQRVTSYLYFMKQTYEIADMAVLDSDLTEIYEDERFKNSASMNFLSLNKKQKKQYFYLQRILYFFEEAFVLRSHHWIGEQEYAGLVINWMKEILELRYFQIMWKELKAYYQPQFVVYLDRLIASDPDKFNDTALAVARLRNKEAWVL
jgi:hypothetical protein